MQTQAPAVPRFVSSSLRDSACLIRELMPADSGACEAFFNRLEAADIGARYASRRFSLDYFLPKPVGKVDGMAFAAFDSAQELLGVVNLALLGPRSAEIAVIVRSDRKRRGIGRRLVAHALEWADAHCIVETVAYASVGNQAVLALLDLFGFAIPAASSPYLEITRCAPAERRGQGCEGEWGALAA